MIIDSKFHGLLLAGHVDMPFAWLLLLQASACDMSFTPEPAHRKVPTHAVQPIRSACTWLRSARMFSKSLGNIIFNSDWRHCRRVGLRKYAG